VGYHRLQVQIAFQVSYAVNRKLEIVPGVKPVVSMGASVGEKRLAFWGSYISDEFFEYSF
jgi:hypothetical protein